MPRHPAHSPQIPDKKNLTQGRKDAKDAKRKGENERTRKRENERTEEGKLTQRRNGAKGAKGKREREKGGRGGLGWGVLHRFDLCTQLVNLGLHRLLTALHLLLTSFFFVSHDDLRNGNGGCD